MEVQLIHEKWSKVECDALLVPLFEDQLDSEGLAQEINISQDGLLSELEQNGGWTGEQGENTTIYRPRGTKIGRLILIGAGPKNLYSEVDYRALFMSVVVSTKAYRLPVLGILSVGSPDPKRMARCALEGLMLGVASTVDEYKTVERPVAGVGQVLLVSEGSEVDAVTASDLERKAGVMATATNDARRWTNEPGNIMSPSRLADQAQKIADSSSLDIEIWDEKRIEKAGMNTLLGVARGSDEPARFVIIRHQGAPSSDSPPGVLIGKGVTFDSGGISIKPSLHMEEMRTDKAGACAVLAAMQAISRLQVPQNVVGLLAVVENLPSGRAQRPGDVVRSMGGKTVEVINTDAEGRLILVDAIHYARQLDPAFIIDIATLTGACVVALGKVRAGIFCNADRLCSAVQEAASKADEKVWPLPLDSEYRHDLRSYIADIKNVGGRWGGAITAAKFLEEFVGEIPWCHMDIAGVSLYPEGSVVKGATGFGVRTLVEIVSDSSLYPE